MLNKLFEDIINKKSFYFASNDGDQFEQKIKNKLKSFSFSEINNSSQKELLINISELEGIEKKKAGIILSDIKKKILLKNSTEIFESPFTNIDNAFIFQPNGSQNFPDFLIIDEGKLIPLEVKFSKKPTKNKDGVYPMWNSNLPKHNAIYIFGVASTAVTFFMGSDILSIQTRNLLLNFFEGIDRKKESFNKELSTLENEFGIYPYVRKAYDHKASKSTRKNPLNNNKLEVESYFSEKAPEREATVLSFFEELKNAD